MIKVYSKYHGQSWNLVVNWKNRGARRPRPTSPPPYFLLTTLASYVTHWSSRPLHTRERNTVCEFECSVLSKHPIQLFGWTCAQTYCKICLKEISLPLLQSRLWHSDFFFCRISIHLLYDGCVNINLPSSIVFPVFPESRHELDSLGLICLFGREFPSNPNFMVTIRFLAIDVRIHQLCHIVTA